jgi:hypothetical protein
MVLALQNHMGGGVRGQKHESCPHKELNSKGVHREWMSHHGPNIWQLQGQCCTMVSPTTPASAPGP